MSRHSQSELDALLSAMTGETVSSSTGEATLLCEDTKQLTEASKEFDNGYRYGLNQPLDDVKKKHDRAHELAQSHMEKYKQAAAIQQQTPELAKAKLLHGNKFHTYTRIRDGLAQAMKEREKGEKQSESPVKGFKSMPIKVSEDKKVK